VRHDLKTWPEYFAMVMEMCLVLHHIQCKCSNGHEWDCAVGAIWCQMPTCPECQEQATAMKGVWFRPFHADGEGSAAE